MSLIITAAVTGGEYVSRIESPYVPRTVDEVVEEVVRSVEAGASVVHLHAKNPTNGEAYSGDPNPVLREYVKAIRERVDVVINVTTGGGRVGNPPEVWDRLVKEKCDCGQEMMSLNMGTINRWAEHPTGDVFLNTVPMIERWASYMRDAGIKPEHEVYDTGMINTCRVLVEKKITKEPLHIQFVMVGRTGFLPNIKALTYSLDQIPPTWTWSVCALGRNEIPMCNAAMLLGGHVRVGFEDNVFLRKGEYAKSNADLVRKIANIAKELERPVADPSEARKILGLKKP